MAEEAQAVGDIVERRLDFVGMDNLLATYSDGFLVAKTGDMHSLFFFQTQIPTVKDRVLGSSETLDAREAKCVARIVLSDAGFSKLLDAMASTIGKTVMDAIKEDATKEKE